MATETSMPSPAWSIRLITEFDAADRGMGALGVNYLLTYLLLGTMSLNEALRSLQLFATEVMPKLAAL